MFCIVIVVREKKKIENLLQ